MVSRRAVLQGVAGGAVALLPSPKPEGLAIEQPVDVLVSELSQVMDGSASLVTPPLAPHVLRRMVPVIRHDVQASRYDRLSLRLPILIRSALACRTALSGSAAATRVDAGLTSLFCIASEAMVKFGERGLAEAAAKEATAHAGASTDVAALAEAAQMRGILARKAGRFGDAVDQVVAAADELAGRMDPEALSVRGSLLNTAGYTAARGGDRELSRELLDAADALARQVGRDGNWRNTAFGPTNVRFYRMGSADALGDHGEALSVARSIRVDEIPHAERRTRYWLDVARTFAHCGRSQECLQALFRAERVAPAEVRSRQVTQELVRQLLDGRGRVDPVELRRFAARAGFKP